MTWREIEDFEKPYLQALGLAVRSLRQHAGLSQAAVADLTGMNPRTIERIEAGHRRTRRSTLARILTALIKNDNGLGEIDYLLEGLIRRAGPALAPESAHAKRIEARRVRRENRKEREWLRQMAVEDEAQRLSALYFAQHVNRLRSGGHIF